MFLKHTFLKLEAEYEKHALESHRKGSCAFHHTLWMFKSCFHTDSSLSVNEMPYTKNSFLFMFAFFYFTANCARVHALQFNI